MCAPLTSWDLLQSWLSVRKWKLAQTWQCIVQCCTAQYGGFNQKQPGENRTQRAEDLLRFAATWTFFFFTKRSGIWESAISPVGSTKPDKSFSLLLNVCAVEAAITRRPDGKRSVHKIPISRPIPRRHLSRRRPPGRKVFAVHAVSGYNILCDKW